MNFQKAKLSIIAIFLVFLTINIIICFIIKETVWPDKFNKLLIIVLQAYSVHAAVIFASSFKNNDDQQIVPKSTFFLAASLSVIWNLILCIRMLFFVCSQDDQIQQLFTFLQDVSAGSSFLLAGMLAFFFNNSKG